METAAILAAIMIFGIAVFQFLIAIGLPVGKAAWGGQNKVVPNNLRIVSAVFVVIYLIVALSILSVAGFFEAIPAELAKIITWFFTAFFGVGVVMNLISRSKIERLWAPYLAVLFALCLYVLL